MTHTWECWCCGGLRPSCGCDIYFDAKGGADEYCAAHDKTWLPSDKARAFLTLPPGDSGADPMKENRDE